MPRVGARDQGYLVALVQPFICTVTCASLISVVGKESTQFNFQLSGSIEKEERVITS
jgi:hypothetical protein